MFEVEAGKQKVMVQERNVYSHTVAGTLSSSTCVIDNDSCCSHTTRGSDNDHSGVFTAQSGCLYKHRDLTRKVGKCLKTRY